MEQRHTSQYSQRQRSAAGRPWLRRVLASTWILVVLGAASVATGFAQDYQIAKTDRTQFFRIGTGTTGGTYFPVGGAIANAISNPPGSRDCERGGTCGVPGLIAAALSTSGSVQNVEGIHSGEFESGLSQADVAFLAYTGTGIFSDRAPLTDLRTITNLYPESVHLVARFESGIRSVDDLKGKRVSVDREGSGTKVDAELILSAYGLSLDDIDVQHLPVGPAADMLRAGELDAFFAVVGTPAVALEDLARELQIRLIPLDGSEVSELRETYPFFTETLVPAGTYANVPATHTLAVGAQWLVSARVPEELVYQITTALWHPGSAEALARGHPKSTDITLESALDGLAVPLHPGAARFYRERGLLESDSHLARPPGKAVRLKAIESAPGTRS